MNIYIIEMKVSNDAIADYLSSHEILFDNRLISKTI